MAIGARAASGVPVGNGARAAKGAVSVSAGVGVGAGTEQPAATANNSKDTIAVTRSFNMPAVYHPDACCYANFAIASLTCSRSSNNSCA